MKALINNIAKTRNFTVLYDISRKCSSMFKVLIRTRSAVQLCGRSPLEMPSRTGKLEAGFSNLEFLFCPWQLSTLIFQAFWVF
jgi:hypothetical protein